SMGAVLNEPTTPAPMQQMILSAITSAGLKEAPGDWAWAVRSLLTANDEGVAEAAIEAARVLSQAKTNAPHFSDVLMRIARDGEKPADLRLEACNAVSGGLKSVEPELFAFLCANVDPGKPVAVRSAAVGALAKAKLNEAQLLALTEVVREAGPLEMTRLLGAFEHTTDETVGLKLMDSLKEAKGVASLRPDLLKTLTAKYPASVQAKAQQLTAALNADAANQAAHIDELMKNLKDGDVRRGQALFNSQKAACSSCHTMGYMGGKVGPDLTTIGQVRTERDLLESVVYPSASFVRSFEPYIVMTKSDEAFTGVLKKDAADEVILATGPQTEARIARSDITDMRPGTVSVMPGGFEQQFSKQELADLVAFLKSTKWGPR
ncbi:MAG TPA: dehydrogenase, partial [Candidatus Dormibacteraeota bacterium]|nr:dehydrogenase [Candidatus Dormibacteraeota bacterium]